MPKKEFIQSPYDRPRKRPRDWSRAWMVILLVSALAAGLYFLAPGLLKPLGLGPGHQALSGDTEGKKYLSILGTKHSFVTNQKEGALLVVTGLVKNYYVSTRRNLRVRGQLFDADGHILDEKIVYCGPWLDRKALESRPYPAIQKALVSEEPRDDSRADSGQSIPYQVVFNPIPGAFSGYTIEAAGSEKAD